MLCRALLAAAVISYLLCVLLLSGVQKDDIDGGTLRKLQRHNVNIDVINTPEMRKECLKDATDITTLTTLMMEVDTTTETAFTMDPEIDDGLEEPSKLRNILKYILNQQKSLYLPIKLDRETTETPKVINNFDYLRRRLSRNNDIIDRATKSEYIKPVTVFEKSDCAPQTILDLWKKFSNIIEVKTETPKAMFEEYDKIYRSKNTPNEAIRTPMVDTVKSKDVEYIKGIVANILEARDTTEAPISTSSAPFIPTSIFQRIDKILKENASNKQPTNYYLNNLYDRVMEYDDNRNKLQSNLMNTLLNSSNNAYVTQSIADNMLGKIRDNTKYEKEKTNENNFQDVKQNLKQGNDDATEKYKNATKFTEKDDYKKSQSNNVKLEGISQISPDIIKAIAESVKAIVLKDLQKEITTSMTSTASPTTVKPTSTTRTTPVPTTTAPVTIKTSTTIITTPVKEELSTTVSTQKPSKTPDTSVAIEKFMELFEQLKSMKANTTPNTIETNTYKQVNIKVYEKPLNKIYLPPMPAINPYGIGKMRNKKPIILDPYTDKEQNVFVSQNFAKEVSPKQIKPLTIQTNSEVIPPLGIPVLNPMIFHQNIIVTTRHPFKWRNGRQNREYNFRKPNEYQNRNKYYKYDRSRFRHDDRSVLAKAKDIFQRITADKTDGVGKLPYGIQRYHEKLEKNDYTSRHVSRERPFYINDKSNANLAPRQQRPLNQMGSGYDDTHFKNFLRTQQKVNAMLERILATNTKHGARSVETT